MLSLWWLATTRLATYMKFSKCLTAVSNIRSSRFSLRAKEFFGCSMTSLKLTVHQVSAEISDVRKQFVSVICQNGIAGNHIHGRSQKAF
jgi:hypothetical protein